MSRHDPDVIRANLLWWRIERHRRDVVYQDVLPTYRRAKENVAEAEQEIAFLEGDLAKAEGREVEA